MDNHFWPGLPNENAAARLDRLDVWRNLALAEILVDEGKQADAWEHVRQAARGIVQMEYESRNTQAESDELVSIVNSFPAPK